MMVYHTVFVLMLLIVIALQALHLSTGIEDLGGAMLFMLIGMVAVKVLLMATRESRMSKWATLRENLILLVLLALVLLQATHIIHH